MSFKINYAAAPEVSGQVENAVNAAPENVLQIPDAPVEIAHAVIDARVV